MDGANIAMCTPAGYIDINRRFYALHGSGGVQEAAASSYLRGSFADSTLGWDELLKERLVVVLGEPGSGKSWEFRRRCASLKEAGKPAFLIELERLVAGLLLPTSPASSNGRAAGTVPAFSWIPSMRPRSADKLTSTRLSTS